MESTDCFLAVEDHHASFSEIQKEIRYCGRDVAVLSRIVESMTKSTLVLALCDHKDRGKALAKVLCTHFAQTFVTPKGSYTQFTMSFIDESAGDIVHCPCDRVTDIGDVIDEEDGEHRCFSLRASTVTPTVGSFAFTDVCLTLLIWSENAYDTDLAHFVDGIATILGTKPKSIGVYFSSGEIPEIGRYIEMAKELQGVCKKRVFGEEKRISLSSRLECVRAWSLVQNECYHFSPQQEGPYFVNLNPQLAVGEKLAHAIFPGVSYIAANDGNAGPIDFIISPKKNGESGANYRSICSPHCCISCDKDSVRISPVCGMTYVNGAPLSAEIKLQHNDRIILGREVVLRFVLVKKRPASSTSSQILDCETCCRELDQNSKNTLEHVALRRLEKELNETQEEYNSLRRQLKFMCRSEDCIWLIINNPPTDFNGSFVWELGWIRKGESVTIGPDSDLSLPFLTDSVVISRAAGGFSYSSNGVTVKLLHGSRFVVGDTVFSVSIRYAPPKETYSDDLFDAPARIEPYSDDDIRDVRNSLFELQWTIAMLFDFVFPPEKPQEEGNENTDDVFYVRRRQMNSDAILTSKYLRLDNISRLAGRITETTRMICSEIASEVGYARLTGNCFDRGGAVNGSKCTARELLDIISRQTRLSYDVIQKLHEPLDKILKNGDPQTEKNSNGNVELLKSKVLGDGDVSLATVAEKVLAIRAHFFLASKAVIRRMGCAVDALSVSSRPKEIWGKYLKALDTLLKPHSDLAKVPTTKKEKIALALVDVLVAMEYTMSKGYLSSKEEEDIARRFPSWIPIAEHCLSCFKKSTTLKGVGTSKGPAAVRRTGPSLRRDTPGESTLSSRKPLSRPAAPPSANGRSSPSLSTSQPLQSRAASGGSPRRLPSGRKLPSAPRSSTPLSSSLLGKSPGVSRTPMGITPCSPRSPVPLTSAHKTQRASSASQSAGGTKTQRIGSITPIQRSLGGTAPCLPSRLTKAPVIRSSIEKPATPKGRISCASK